MSSIFVKAVDVMGTDATVVNAARVSFGKRTSAKERVEVDLNEFSTVNIPVLEEKDRNLLRYLATHNHWSPFGHCSLQFHIRAPIFVARQLVKHQIGLTWNEISRRYVDDDPEFYDVDVWRARAENKKQGSNETETVEWISRNRRTDTLQIEVENIALKNYKLMLERGVCPEQARMLLPQSMMTEWYWSGTLYAFARVCILRCAKDSQYETRIVANEIFKHCNRLFPHSWEALFKSASTTLSIYREMRNGTSE